MALRPPPEPPTPRDDQGELIGPLQSYVRRRLRYYEALGELEPGDLEPEDVIDRTYLEAGERASERPPRDRGYRFMRMLADRILHREVRRHAAQRQAGEAEAATWRRLPELQPDEAAELPEDQIANAQLVGRLARLLGELPDSLREPFLLVIADGYSLDEVAELEAVPRDEAIRRIAEAGRLFRERVTTLERHTPPRGET